MLIALPLVALVAYFAAQTDWATDMGLGPLPLAILLGILTGNLLPTVTITHRFTETVFNFSKKTLLRAGIILFGSYLTLQQILDVGWQAAALSALVITGVLTFGYWFGVKILKMGKEETLLTSVGSAVCGAAAILATEPVLKAKQQHVSVAVATVVLFGTVALFCYPIIYQLSSLNSAAFGIFIGATVHEVAQAAAAGQAINPEAMNNAIIVKLTRVMMLAPVVAIIAWLYQRTEQNKSKQTLKLQWPWFVIGFIAVVTLNSIITMPHWMIHIMQNSAMLCLTIAMAALGLQTQFSAIRQAGTKPLALSAFLFVLLLSGGFLIYRLLY